MHLSTLLPFYVHSVAVAEHWSVHLVNVLYFIRYCSDTFKVRWDLNND